MNGVNAQAAGGEGQAADVAIGAVNAVDALPESWKKTFKLVLLILLMLLNIFQTIALPYISDHMLADSCLARPMCPCYNWSGY